MNKHIYTNSSFSKIIKYASILVLSVTIGSASANSQQPVGGELHYTGAVTGSAVFNTINCTLRAGHLVGLGYYAAIGKALGPNVALFTTNDDGTGQHLGFVPSGKSQQAYYFNARASGTIPGLDATQVSTTKTVTLKHVELRNPGTTHDRLTLSGTLFCTKITR